MAKAAIDILQNQIIPKIISMNLNYRSINYTKIFHHIQVLQKRFIKKNIRLPKLLMELHPVKDICKNNKIKQKTHFNFSSIEEKTHNADFQNWITVYISKINVLDKIYTLVQLKIV